MQTKLFKSSLFFYLIGSSELQGITDFKNFLNSLEILDWPYLASDFNFNHSLPMIFANFAVYADNDYIILHHVALENTEVQTSGIKVRKKLTVMPTKKSVLCSKLLQFVFISIDKMCIVQFYQSFLTILICICFFSMQIYFYPHDFNSSTQIPQEHAINILKNFNLEPDSIDVIIKDHELVRNSIINLYEVKFHLLTFHLVS